MTGSALNSAAQLSAAQQLRALAVVPQATSAAAGDGAEVCAQSIGEWLKMDPVELAGLSGRSLSTIADALAVGRAAVATAATQREDIRTLQESTRTDALTGIWNRRAIDERLHTEWARWQRYKTPLAVLMADVDGLKAVNDSRGHDSGDLLIGAVARQLASLIRAEDAVGRLGGDEFMIVCAEANEESTQAILRNVNAALTGQWVDVQGGSIPVEVSIGCASTSMYPASSLAELVRTADAGLYAVKQARQLERIAAGQPPTPAERLGLRPHRMLIVDDDPYIRLMLRAYLEPLPDFVVVGEASNGAEAIHLVDQLKPAGIVLDNEMPIMRGSEAIPFMRSISPELRIVMHSGTASAGTSLVASERADHYIQKGGRMADFLDQLSAVMAGPRDMATVQGGA